MKNSNLKIHQYVFVCGLVDEYLIRNCYQSRCLSVKTPSSGQDTELSRVTSPPHTSKHHSFPQIQLQVYSSKNENKVNRNAASIREDDCDGICTHRVNNIRLTLTTKSWSPGFESKPC